VKIPMKLGAESSALTFTASAHAPRKRLILSRAGHPVYIGAIGDPIEDVEFDGVTLSVGDFASLKDATDLSD